MLPRYSPGYITSLIFPGPAGGDVSLVDSAPLVAAGIGYAFEGWDLQNQSSVEVTATLGLALPVVPGILNVGTALKYVNLVDALGALGAVGAGDALNILSSDLGILAMIPEAFSWRRWVTTYSVKTEAMPLSVGLGLAWDWDRFLVCTGQTTTAGSF